MTLVYVSPIPQRVCERGWRVFFCVYRVLSWKVERGKQFEEEESLRVTTACGRIETVSGGKVDLVWIKVSYMQGISKLYSCSSENSQ
jgi:hypothetical protein